MSIEVNKHINADTKITAALMGSPSHPERFAILSFGDLYIFLISSGDTDRLLAEVEKIHKFLSEVESEQNK